MKNIKKKKLRRKNENIKHKLVFLNKIENLSKEQHSIRKTKKKGRKNQRFIKK